MDDLKSPKEFVGYRKPPKSGQFRKGQSGNPRGRPRKRNPEPGIPDACYPTREYIRREAQRKLTINDANGQSDITTRQAVIRAIYLKAAQGSVVAQRTAIMQMHLEDERHHKEKKERFDYWSERKFSDGVKLAAAIKAGKSAPEYLPHPDDIELHHSTFDVRLRGASNSEEREREKNNENIQALAYEVSTFLSASYPGDVLDEAPKGVDPYLVLYLWAFLALPPRLRREPQSFDQELKRWMWQGLHAWRADLRQRCADAGFYFAEIPPTSIIPWDTLKRVGFISSTQIDEIARTWRRPPKTRKKRQAPAKMSS